MLCRKCSTPRPTEGYSISENDLLGGYDATIGLALTSAEAEGEEKEQQDNRYGGVENSEENLRLYSRGAMFEHQLSDNLDERKDFRSHQQEQQSSSYYAFNYFNYYQQMITANMSDWICISCNKLNYPSRRVSSTTTLSRCCCSPAVDSSCRCAENATSIHHSTLPWDPSTGSPHLFHLKIIIIIINYGLSCRMALPGLKIGGAPHAQISTLHHAPYVVSAALHRLGPTAVPLLLLPRPRPQPRRGAPNPQTKVSVPVLFSLLCVEDA